MNLPSPCPTRLADRFGTADRLPVIRLPRSPWRGVFFEGPRPGRDADGQEIPVWVVFVGNKEAEPVGRVYRCYSFSLAEGLARRMAEDRGLELVQEATTA